MDLVSDMAACRAASLSFSSASDASLHATNFPHVSQPPLSPMLSNHSRKRTCLTRVPRAISPKGNQVIFHHEPTSLAKRWEALTGQVAHVAISLEGGCCTMVVVHEDLTEWSRIYDRRGWSRRLPWHMARPVFFFIHRDSSMGTSQVWS